MAFVYAFQSGIDNFFKIGRTGDHPDIRRKSLSTGNPQPLSTADLIETPYEILCETYLKRVLRSKRRTEGDGTEIFELALDELREAFDDAREFLQDYLPREQEADLLSREQSDGQILIPGERERELYQQLLKIRETEDRLRFERELVESELKLAIGKADGLQGIATWKTSSFRRFDRTAFRLADEEMYERFVRMDLRRTFRLWKG